MACKDDVWKIWHRPAGIFYPAADAHFEYGVRFYGWDALYILSFALAILSIFRIFSKNVSKRYEENQKFLQMTAPVRSFFSAKTAGLLDLRTHRHFRCPQCKQKIRVPRGKGNIQITCPKCRHEFVKKS